MGAGTRDLILDTALDLFHENGYTATGVTDITRAAGVPKGSFYHFFDSKETLAVDAVNRYAERTQVQLLTDPSRSPLERIRTHIDHMISLATAAEYPRGCLLGSFSTEMPSQSDSIALAVNERLDAWTDQLALTIAEASAAGEISTHSDPRRMAGFIVAGLEGAFARAKVSRSRSPLDDYRESLFEFVLD